jgi:hypothetical protein
MPAIAADISCRRRHYSRHIIFFAADGHYAS